MLFRTALEVRKRTPWVGDTPWQLYWTYLVVNRAHWGRDELPLLLWSSTPRDTPSHNEGNAEDSNPVRFLHPKNSQAKGKLKPQPYMNTISIVSPQPKSTKSNVKDAPIHCIKTLSDISDNDNNLSAARPSMFRQVECFGPTANQLLQMTQPNQRRQATHHMEYAEGPREEATSSAFGIVHLLTDPTCRKSKVSPHTQIATMPLISFQARQTIQHLLRRAWLWRKGFQCNQDKRQQLQQVSTSSGKERHTRVEELRVDERQLKQETRPMRSDGWVTD